MRKKKLRYVVSMRQDQMYVETIIVLQMPTIEDVDLKTGIS